MRDLVITLIILIGLAIIAATVAFRASADTPTRPQARPDIAYELCERQSDGTLLVAVREGASEALAISQCRAFLSAPRVPV